MMYEDSKGKRRFYSPTFRDEDYITVYEIQARDTSGYSVLGKYSTEAKAIKVLDMIQEAYKSSLYCDYAFDGTSQV